MGHKLHNRIEIWKKLLLDFGKRNRLINFLEGKRSNVRIMTPSFDRLWELVVANEKEIVFPYAKKVQVDDEGEEVYETVIKGDIETNKHIGDLQKTLKALRYKANTSIEEQGINTLYLTFGMLKWKERDDSSQVFSSPVILVPVRLLIESITSPYRLVLHDDEIVINPTLSHKLDNDFGIIMPEFDSTHDSPAEYIEKLLHKVENKGWEVERSTHLTNLSFLKINMYKDLERNEEKINANPVIAALVGEQYPIQVSEELNNFDHDRQIRPIDTFQVVDADSSQQDAVLLSKKGASFVLQGPPGTGKTQTILNIIANLVMAGKSVLVVSNNNSAVDNVAEKMESEGLDFIVAKLGSKENKEAFVANQKGYPLMDLWKIENLALVEQKYAEALRDVELGFESQSKKAILKAELDALERESRYDELHHNVNDEYKWLYLKKSYKLMALRLVFGLMIENKKKPNLWFKIKWGFLLGVRIFSLLNIEPRIIVDMLESAYYIAKKREIESELLVYEKVLSTIDITQRIKDLKGSAMARFKYSIANRYKSEVRKKFALKSIKSQLSSS